MSGVSQILEHAGRFIAEGVETIEKSDITSAVETEVATLILSETPTTEAEAITLVNGHVSEIVSRAIASVGLPNLDRLLESEKSAIEAWVEGVADGLVAGVFATIKANAASALQAGTGRTGRQA